MEIVETLNRCVRILYISRKPTNDEFQKVAKVTGIGIIVIGLIGLVLSVVMAFIDEVSIIG